MYWPLERSQEIPGSCKKATEDAKKKLIFVPMVGTTVPHQIVGIFGAGKVLIMPSAVLVPELSQVHLYAQY